MLGLLLCLTLLAVPALADDYDYNDYDAEEAATPYDDYRDSRRDQESYHIYDHGSGNYTVEDERGNREVIRVYDHGSGNVTVERR